MADIPYHLISPMPISRPPFPWLAIPILVGMTLFGTVEVVFGWGSNFVLGPDFLASYRCWPLWQDQHHTGQHDSCQLLGSVMSW
jgi:hypothetical protein